MQSAVAGAGRRLIRPRLPLLPRYRCLYSTQTTTAPLRDSITSTEHGRAQDELFAKWCQKLGLASRTKIPSKKELSRLRELVKSKYAEEWAAYKSKAHQSKPQQLRTQNSRTQESKTNEKTKVKIQKGKQNQNQTRVTLSEATASLEFGLSKLLATLNLPTKEQYPNVPQDILENPEKCLRKILTVLQADLTVGSSLTEGRPPLLPLKPDGRPMSYLRRTFTLKLRHRGKKVRIVAAGDVIGPKEQPYISTADNAASLHILAKMHEADILKYAWAGSTDVIQESEANGIVDVFNYAARYGCVPQCSVQPGAGRYVDMEIRMPEHGINVIVHATSLSRAQARASAEFKRQAEVYHLREGTESFAVKDLTTINTENATMFFRLCKKAGEVQTYDFDAVQSNQNHNAWEGRAIIDGKIFSEAVMIEKDGRRAAPKIASLIAALSIAEQKPHLLEIFRKKLSEGPEVRRADSTELVVGEQTLQTIQALNRSTTKLGEPRQRGRGIRGQSEEEHSRSFRQRSMLAGHELAEKSIQMQKKLASYETQPDLEQLRRTRSELPMSQYARQVEEIVRNNIYCVIVGATGSGKTTQVPQILLDQAIREGKGAECNIICTQPRRIAATSVARRVADERAEKLQDTVGYHVRFDAKLPEPSGSVLFCTTGILLQQLQNAPDEVYDRASHLVIDEVHERDIIIDFLLVILKKTMALRVAQGKRIPHVVLMSATIDAERFSEYFKDSLPSQQPTDCPTLSVPGRTFPVKERYLDDLFQELKHEHGQAALKYLETDRDTRDYLAAERTARLNHESSSKAIIDWKTTIGGRPGEATSSDSIETLVPVALAATTVAHIAKTTSGGAILVFLPGLQDILDLEKLLRERQPLGVDFNDEAGFKIFMLHSSVLDQKSVFDSLPSGCRKIILSTNIAETSVTIPDVQFVVDTGKSREKQYDQVRGVTQLQCTWISRSNVKQRAGRAGRVQDGNYYALYSESRLRSMRAVGLPELLRSELQEVCLDVKAQAFKMPVRDFLAEAIEPPAATAVDDALKSLRGLGALTKEEELTPLGRVLASLPVHPALGKMIILGIIFRCLEPMIILGAAAGGRSLIMNPPGAQRQVKAVVRDLADGCNSDHLVVLKAFRMARQAADVGGLHFLRICSQNFLHGGAFKTIHSTANQIVEILQEAGLIRSDSPISAREPYGGLQVNENSDSQELIKALLLAGLYPNIAIEKKGFQNKRISFRTRDEFRVGIHPSSINDSEDSKDDNPQRTRLVSFTNLALSSNGGLVSMRETTLVTPLMAVLVADCQAKIDRTSIELDKWLPFSVGELPRAGFTANQMETPQRTRFERGRIVAQLGLLRKRLEKMLAIAFDDLTRKVPLAENRMHQELARGVARVLELNKADLETARQGFMANAPRRNVSDRSGSYQLDLDGNHKQQWQQQRRAKEDERAARNRFPPQTHRGSHGRKNSPRSIGRDSSPTFSSSERRADYQ